MNRKIKLGDSEVSITDAIIAFEGGELGEDAIVALFQALIDTGLAWRLQGSYGRLAKALIEAGRCHR